jgi:hypothetical protein
LNIPIIFSCENVEHGNDAGYTLDLKLYDIPKVITINEKSYELRGVIHFRRGNNNLRNSVGHYKTHVKRFNEHWELFDDLKKTNTCQRNY